MTHRPSVPFIYSPPIDWTNRNEDVPIKRGVTISKVWTFNYFLIVVIVSFEANSLLFLLVMHCCNLLYIHGNINPYNPLKKTFIRTNLHACGILWNWARWQKKRTIEINNNNWCNLTLSIVILYHYVKMLNFMSVQCYHIIMR